MSVRITRTNLEHLLDAGLVQALMSNGNWWAIRRSGKTQSWKTRPDDFRIPFKMGLYGNGAVTHGDMSLEGVLDEQNFRIDPAQAERANELCAYIDATKGV